MLVSLINHIEETPAITRGDLRKAWPQSMLNGIIRHNKTKDRTEETVGIQVGVAADRYNKFRIDHP